MATLLRAKSLRLRSSAAFAFGRREEPILLSRPLPLLRHYRGDRSLDGRSRNDFPSYSYNLFPPKPSIPPPFDADSFRHEQSTPPINWGICCSVPKKTCYVVERLGKQRILGSGIHLFIPLVDRIVQVLSLSETNIFIHNHSVFTKDKINIYIDSRFTVKIVDPMLAYCMKGNSLFYSVFFLVKSSLLSELRRITLDKMAKEMDTLKENIVRSVNEVASDWGLKCLHYEICAISLEGDGNQSEAATMDDINRAIGEAEAILLKAAAEVLRIISEAGAISSDGEAETILLKASAEVLRIISEAGAISSEGDGNQSEAATMDDINRAIGEAEAILLKAIAEVLRIIPEAGAISSEGERQANINIGDGNQSEAAMMAKGEAEAILLKAAAEVLKIISKQIHGLMGDVKSKSLFQKLMS